MQLLSMKKKIVMSLTGIFQREDIYCQKYWRQVQHVCNEIWTQRKKEVFATLSLIRNGIAPIEIFKLEMQCWCGIIQ